MRSLTLINSFPARIACPIYALASAHKVNTTVHFVVTAALAAPQNRARDGVCASGTLLAFYRL